MEHLGHERSRGLARRWLEDLWTDLRYAIRTLARSPGFLVFGTMSLALGIGPNTAIFGLLHAVLLRPLPVAAPEQLVEAVRVSATGDTLDTPYPFFESLRHMKSLSGVAAEMESSPTIVIDGAEEMVNAELVSGAHYPLLGIRPAAGRLLDETDDTASAAPVAVIGYRYWQRRFALDPSVIGRQFLVQVQNRTFTIVGVTPARYWGTRVGNDPDITLPLAMMATDAQRQSTTMNLLSVLGRLSPGVTLEQANAELQPLTHAYIQEAAPRLKDPRTLTQTRSHLRRAANGLAPLRDNYAEALFVLMGLVSLVLVLSCANLSAVLVARAAARHREISIRLALGARGGRLIRQFLTEGLILAILGAAVGLVLGQWLSRALVGMMANGGPLPLDTTPDWRVLTFTALTAIVASLLAGLAPAVYALRVNLTPGLKQARAGSHLRLGKILVAVQLSISMVLVVGAGLFLDSLVTLYRLDAGIRTEGLLTARVWTSERLPPAHRWVSLDALLDRIGALPGVASASVASAVPLSGALLTRRVLVEGYTSGASEGEDIAYNLITPNYFATIGTPLSSGRDFGRGDTTTSEPVAIVNERFVRRFFDGQPSVGRTIVSGKATRRIVGVVKDAKYQHLRDPVRETMYVPWAQRENQPARANLLVRMTSGDASHSAPVLARLFREVDPNLRSNEPITYSTLVTRSLLTERIMASLGGVFGLLALAIAWVGVFGAVSFNLSRRVSEIGLRLALGAARRDIVTLVLREVAIVLVVSWLIGSAVAVALSGLARTVLASAAPTGPGVFVLSAVVLGAAVVAATWLPAWKAAHTDPLVTLRLD